MPSCLRYLTGRAAVLGASFPSHAVDNQGPWLRHGQLGRDSETYIADRDNGDVLYMFDLSAYFTSMACRP